MAANSAAASGPLSRARTKPWIMSRATCSSAVDAGLQQPPHVVAPVVGEGIDLGDVHVGGRQSGEVGCLGEWRGVSAHFAALLSEVGVPGPVHEIRAETGRIGVLAVSCARRGDR